VTRLLYGDVPAPLVRADDLHRRGEVLRLEREGIYPGLGLRRACDSLRSSGILESGQALNDHWPVRQHSGAGTFRRSRITEGGTADNRVD
jgi:hypothetical protein